MKKKRAATSVQDVRTQKIKRWELTQLYQFGGVFELAAGGVDVASARTAEEGGDSGGDEDGLEGEDAVWAGHEVRELGAGIEGDEVDLGAESADEVDEIAGVGRVVVEAAEEDVLEGETLAVAEREVAQGGEKLLDGPLASDGHDFGAKSFVGSVEGDGELGADVFGAEVGDARDDAGGGDGHARGGNSGIEDEAADGLHEVVVVEERFALSHEDEVDAVAVNIDALVVERGEDLANDFAWGEIALEAEKGRHAELAVDGAADLGGDADGGAARTVSSFKFRVSSARESFERFITGVGAVAGFTAVAFEHPDGFDGLAVGELEEVADGAVGGGEFLIDGRQSNGVAELGELLAQRLGKGGELIEARPALAVEAVQKLAEAIGSLGEAFEKLGKLFIRKA